MRYRPPLGCPARPCRAGGAAVSPSLASTLFLTGTWEPRHLASDHRRCDICPGGEVGDEGIGAALDMVAAAGRHVEDMARSQSSARRPAVGASVPLGPVPRQRGLQPQPLHFRSSDPPGVLAVRALTGLCWVLKTRRQVEETDVARQERWWTPRAVTKSPPIHVGRRRGWSYRNKQLGRRHDRLVCRHRVGDTGAATTSPRKHSRRWCHSGWHAC